MMPLTGLWFTPSLLRKMGRYVELQARRQNSGQSKPQLHIRMNQMHAAISQRLLHNSSLYAFRRSKFKLFASLHAKVSFTALRSMGHEITLWRHHEFRSRHNR